MADCAHLDVANNVGCTTHGVVGLGEGLTGRSVGLIPRQRQNQDEEHDGCQNEQTNADSYADLVGRAVVLERVLADGGTIKHVNHLFSSRNNGVVQVTVMVHDGWARPKSERFTRVYYIIKVGISTIAHHSR